MQKMSKEEFIEILSRQQRSGLTIKDFCIIIAHFSGMAESQAAMQLLTQLCNRHVLPE